MDGDWSSSGHTVLTGRRPMPSGRVATPLSGRRRTGSTFVRQGGKGQWKWKQEAPTKWEVQIDRLRLELKPTGFGHVGLFPEHSCHWAWIAERIGMASATSLLHLFAYTGATSLQAAAAGAEVCHVDAVRDINDWARRNQTLSGLDDAPIRWIADDAVKFAAREVRRERRYDAIILDPPSFGRGPKGERWVLEEHLTELMNSLLAVTSDTPRFVLFTGHNPGFSPPVMANMLRPWQQRFGGQITSGTTVLTGADGDMVLPSGFFARWSM